MTTDLWMLVYAGILSAFFYLTYAFGNATTPGGLVWLFGNRETDLASPAWTKRAERAHRNLVENIAPFAILVFAAHLSGRASATTALGAELFFWARVAYAACYIAGVTYVRTGLFLVSVIGELIILSQLF